MRCAGGTRRWRPSRVPNQGHAPLLKDPTTTEAIRHFLTAADAGRQFATLASALIG